MTHKKPPLENYRKEIDSIDFKILNLLAERAELSKKIARLKAVSGHPLYDRAREKIALIARITGAKDLRLDQAFIGRIFAEIFRNSVRIQKKILKTPTPFDIKDEK